MENATSGSSSSHVPGFCYVGLHPKLSQAALDGQLQKSRNHWIRSVRTVCFSVLPDTCTLFHPKQCLLSC